MQNIVIESDISLTVEDELVIRERISTLVSKFIRADSTAVSLKQKDDWYKAELVVVADGMTVRAEKLGSSITDAVRHAAGYLETQLEKYQAPLSTEGYPDDLVVREKHFPIRRQALNNVVLEMELSGHDFFLFQDIESGAVKLLYRRADGKYGLLVPHANDL